MGSQYRQIGEIIFFFFFFYSHLTPHSPTGMAGGKDYAGARRAKAGTYKAAAIPTPRATTTDPDKVLTQKEKKEKQTTPANLPPPPFATTDDMSPSLR